MNTRSTVNNYNNKNNKNIVKQQLQQNLSITQYNRKIPQKQYTATNILITTTTTNVN